MVRMWHTSCDPILFLAVELYFQGILQKFVTCALQAYEMYIFFVFLAETSTFTATNIWQTLRSLKNSCYVAQGSSSFQTLDVMWALGIDCTLIMVKTVNFKARLDWGASLSGCSGMRFAGYASAEIRCLERRDKNQREIKDCGMSIHVISYVYFSFTQVRSC